jgi:Holliday junction DNA helicase RuvB
MVREAITRGEEASEDRAFQTLRPNRLNDFVGQTEIKDQLRLTMEAASKRNEPLDHVLLHGPPGLGKTSLAYIVAKELDVNIRLTSGPVIERPGDLAALVNSMGEGDILFIDEIHRLRRQVEEVLYPAMEDFKLDIMAGEGMGAQSIRIDVARFTLVGATTRTGLLTSPLRDRFEVIFHLDFYSEEELQEIIRRGAQILDVEITSEGALEIARRARGTPRVAHRLLKRVRDFAQVRGGGFIDEPVAQEALELLGVDSLGLNSLDRKILETITEKFSGGPVGIETLAASLSEEKDTISEVYEPFLLKKGFIQRTQQGRVATERAYRHLGIKLPSQQALGLLGEE